MRYRGGASLITDHYRTESGSDRILDSTRLRRFRQTHGAVPKVVATIRSLPLTVL